MVCTCPTARGVDTSDSVEGPCNGSDAEFSSSLTEVEAEFLNVLYTNLDKFNQTYLESEESFVIHMRELADGFRQSERVDDLSGIYKSYVDLHGEMLLLMNWSMLAYTSIVKILKKHEKVTGHKLHAPHMEDLLKQPFCSTEVRKRFCHVPFLQGFVSIMNPFCHVGDHRAGPQGLRAGRGNKD